MKCAACGQAIDETCSYLVQHCTTRLLHSLCWHQGGEIPCTSTIVALHVRGAVLYSEYAIRRGWHRRTDEFQSGRATCRRSQVSYVVRCMIRRLIRLHGTAWKLPVCRNSSAHQRERNLAICHHPPHPGSIYFPAEPRVAHASTAIIMIIFLRTQRIRYFK